ncbi:hypothetical protein VB711_25590 [Cronbergia sp. UHCC 0137]|uniref:hypothetical protein n=1 Tax=Cronbergia sp. UHCC 0137 TaxID=3110239 RepID=UPI002B1FC996|nr:hypothetical protein [Cronbergia sp. UHCC 0137]MEA5621181.1 hypothetical protein [Cronbergia sp. UHCC 0137]
MNRRQIVNRRPNGRRKSFLWRIRQLCRFWQPIAVFVFTVLGFILKFWQPILQAIAQIVEWASHFLND